MSKVTIPGAFGQRLRPLLSEHGFQGKGKKYIRINPDTAQHIFIGVDSRDKARLRFTIQYNTILLWEPQKMNCSLEHGGNFPVGAPNYDSWYKAYTEAHLEQSLDDIASNLDPLLQYFDEATSTQGFLDTYEELLRTRTNVSRDIGHHDFTIACCHAHLGNTKLATFIADEARTQFEVILQRWQADYPDQPHWATDHIAKCDELMKHLEEGNVMPLLERWRAFTATNLKLEL